MFKKLVYFILASIFIYGLIAIYQKASAHFGITLEWKDWVIITLSLLVVFIAFIAVSAMKTTGDIIDGVIKSFWNR